MYSIENCYFDANKLLKELFDLIHAIEKVNWRKEFDRSLINKFIDYKESLKSFYSKLEIFKKENKFTAIELDQIESLKLKFQVLLKSLEDKMPTAQKILDLKKKNLQSEWLNFKKELELNYESFVLNFKAESIHLPHLRPKNYSRNFFHALSGISVMVLVEHIFPRSQLIYIAAFFFVLAWTLDLGRRKFEVFQTISMFLFKKVMHPHERYRVNSATWYTTALFILAAFFPTNAISCSVLILAFSDPAAAIIGRRYGKTKLIHGRSLEGTSAFFVLGVFVSFLFLSIYYTAEMNFLTIAFVSLGSSFFAAIAELLSHKVDDNLTIPLSSAFGFVISLSLIS